MGVPGSREPPSLHLAPTQAEAIAPTFLLSTLSFGAVGSSRQGTPQQLQLLSIPSQDPSESLASARPSVMLSK